MHLAVVPLGVNCLTPTLKISCVTWVSLQLPPHRMSAVLHLCKLSIHRSPENLFLFSFPFLVFHCFHQQARRHPYLLSRRQMSRQCQMRPPGRAGLRVVLKSSSGCKRHTVTVPATDTDATCATRLPVLEAQFQKSQVSHFINPEFSTWSVPSLI